MIDNKPFLMSKLPSILVQENIDRYMNVISKALDRAENEIEYNSKATDINNAIGEQLDVIGLNFGISRNGKTDEEYRWELKIEFGKMDFIPILDNFSNIIESVTGEVPELIEGWVENGARAKMTANVIIPRDFDISILQGFKDLYSLGVQLDYNLLWVGRSRYEGVGTYNGIGHVGLHKIIIDRQYPI